MQKKIVDYLTELLKDDGLARKVKDYEEVIKKCYANEIILYHKIWTQEDFYKWRIWILFLLLCISMIYNLLALFFC